MDNGRYELKISEPAQYKSHLGLRSGRAGLLPEQVERMAKMREAVFVVAASRSSPARGHLLDGACAEDRTICEDRAQVSSRYFSKSEAACGSEK